MKFQLRKSFVILMRIKFSVIKMTQQSHLLKRDLKHVSFYLIKRFHSPNKTLPYFTSKLIGFLLMKQSCTHNSVNHYEF